MKLSISILVISVFLVSCASKQTEKSSGNSTVTKEAVKDRDPLPPDFKFSFYISGTGTASEPADSWTMDTTGTMTVRTNQIVSGAKHEVKALAVLDPVDFDSLRMLIRFGKLYAIDSADLNEQCGSDEYYVLRLIPLTPVHYVSATFDSCAVDYNLLLEPERDYLPKFIGWWERMRKKYRPNIPG